MHNNNIYSTAIGFSPGGSGFKNTYTRILKDTYTKNLDASKILPVGLHEKHVVSAWKLGNHLSICFEETGKPSKKTCIEMAVLRIFRTLTSGQQSGTKVNPSIHKFQLFTAYSTQ